MTEDRETMPFEQVGEFSFDDDSKPQPERGPSQGVGSVVGDHSVTSAQTHFLARASRTLMLHADASQLLERDTRGKNEVVRKTIENVLVVLRNQPEYTGLFAFNRLTQRAERTRETPWGAPAGATDAGDVSHLQHELERFMGHTPSRERIETALTIAANDESFDPLERHVNGLVHDGQSRLDTWLVDYLGVDDSPYVRAVGRAFLISAIARALKPGCKVDTCLVLEGGQGAGKSTTAAILGGVFYVDLPFDPRAKDTLQNMVGHWIVELGELDGLSKADVASTKRFLSVASDVYRRSYGRDSVEVPRRCVFIGTCNESDYLNDPTGARRFWPVRVGQIDVAALRRDRDQLLAEAREAFLAGELWHLVDRSVIDEAAKETSARRAEDPWEGNITSWLDERGGQAELLRNQWFGVRMSALLESALNIEVSKQDQRAAKRVATILKSLGWHRERVRTRDDGEKQRLWCPPKPHPNAGMWQRNA